MKYSKRIDQIPPYLFVQISRKIAEKKAQGIEVISFGIGDPDIATPNQILDGLRKSSNDQANHRYPESEGLPEFRQTVSDWYDSRFNVKLNPQTEVISLIGAKEGIGHAALCFIDPGDICLIPDPGYPVYAVGTLFAGGTNYVMPLLEDNNWLPDLDTIPSHIAEQATMMWLNYPNNPTGAVADLNYFDKVVEFAKKWDVAILHDACYTEVAFDGYKPPSFLQAKGAMDIGIEFHSMSKSYNMTGWRVGMAVGNQEIIEKLLVVKSNLDSGVPGSIQKMAIEAMRKPIQYVDERNDIYQCRRDKVVKVLKEIGLTLESPKASLYVWARVPDGLTSAKFAEQLLEERDVLMIPGGNYGVNGEGYVRLSLTLEDDKIDEALTRISGWHPK